MRSLGLRFLCLLMICWCGAAPAQRVADSDRDGLSDALEQRLLEQFRPEFRVATADCAGSPAAFQRGVLVPTPVAEDGTIYGQVFPHAGGEARQPLLEVHFYHLWRQDCGGHGHPLDAEHVAVLLEGSGPELEKATWKATFWYAAAHEKTVCDVSQIARAASLGAEEHGALVWISPGKHASYLDEALCSRGCGADRCVAMKPLAAGRLVNLGEVARPMNGSVFVGSPAWPLRAKMEASDFSPAVMARGEALSPGQIALSHAGRHPMQGVIAISASTEGAIAESGANTTGALSVAGDRTSGAMSSAGDKTTGALGTASDKTGEALGRSYQDTKHALGNSARQVGKFLGLSKETPKGKEPAADTPR